MSKFQIGDRVVGQKGMRAGCLGQIIGFRSAFPESASVRWDAGITTHGYPLHRLDLDTDPVPAPKPDYGPKQASLQIEAVKDGGYLITGTGDLRMGGFAQHLAAFSTLPEALSYVTARMS